MHLIYVDDSYEKPCQVYAAIAVPAAQWRATFLSVVNWRRRLKLSDGILTTKEFHATDFVAGRGRIGPSVVTKSRRCAIFREAFELMNGIEGLRVFSSCRKVNRDWAFERLITRIHKTMETWDSHAMLICDEGKESEFTRLMRKMGIYNPVPVYVAPGILQVQNLPTVRILEDPFFKPSHRSYFVQMADFVAYGLLRREQALAAKNQYGLNTCFDLLKGIVAREASLTDPMGVIR
jgi:hypothetical protein